MESTTIKEINSRKIDIENQLEDLFKKNMKITDWDVPEADDNTAAQMIVKIMEDKLKLIKEDVDNGKYDFY
ncbi:MAG: hypothetical protein U9Q20_04910 [Campylobacterota bacterium]|nr:hypothetical protein [Campylobacterota bacterium]